MKKTNFEKYMKKFNTQFTDTTAKLIKNTNKTINSWSWTHEPLILYLVFFIALTNAVVYASMKEHNALLVFLLSGIGLSMITKNMTIILLVSIFITNVLYLGQRTLIEGMETKKEEKNKDEEDENDDEEDETPQIDSMKNVKDGIESLQKVLGDKGMEKMSNSIEKYTSMQEGLQNQLNSIKPMMEKMTNIMGTFSKS